jgi:hypothetical protein
MFALFLLGLWALLSLHATVAPRWPISELKNQTQGRNHGTDGSLYIDTKCGPISSWWKITYLVLSHLSNIFTRKEWSLLYALSCTKISMNITSDTNIFTYYDQARSFFQAVILFGVSQVQVSLF